MRSNQKNREMIFNRIKVLFSVWKYEFWHSINELVLKLDSCGRTIGSEIIEHDPFYMTQDAKLYYNNLKCDRFFLTKFTPFRQKFWERPLGDPHKKVGPGLFRIAAVPNVLNFWRNSENISIFYVFKILIEMKFFENFVKKIPSLN